MWSQFHLGPCYWSAEERDDGNNDKIGRTQNVGDRVKLTRCRDDKPSHLHPWRCWFYVGLLTHFCEASIRPYMGVRNRSLELDFLHAGGKGVIGGESDGFRKGFVRAALCIFFFKVMGMVW